MDNIINLPEGFQGAFVTFFFREEGVSTGIKYEAFPELTCKSAELINKAQGFAEWAQPHMDAGKIYDFGVFCINVIVAGVGV